jgi:predicted RNA-binding Zn-ribbon protein involved in translation (DUF1610 family)
MYVSVEREREPKMSNWKIHFIHKCDNCGECWEVRVSHQDAESRGIGAEACEDCGWEVVGLTIAEADIWWAIVDNNEELGAI